MLKNGKKPKIQKKYILRCKIYTVLNSSTKYRRKH